MQLTPPFPVAPRFANQRSHHLPAAASLYTQLELAIIKRARLRNSLLLAWRSTQHGINSSGRESQMKIPKYSTSHWIWSTFVLTSSAVRSLPFPLLHIVCSSQPPLPCIVIITCALLTTFTWLSKNKYRDVQNPCVLPCRAPPPPPSPTTSKARFVLIIRGGILPNQYTILKQRRPKAPVHWDQLKATLISRRISSAHANTAQGDDIVSETRWCIVEYYGAYESLQFPLNHW